MRNSRMLARTGNLRLRGNVYRDEDDGSGPFCPCCWSGQKHPVPLLEGIGGLRNCPVCSWRGFESEADLRRRANEMSRGGY